MEREPTPRRPWLHWGGIALLGLVVRGWGGFLLGRLSPGWGSAPKSQGFTALPGLDWKRPAADSGVTGWTVYHDFPDAARLAEFQSQLAEGQSGTVVDPPLAAQSRNVLAQATVPKAEQNAFGRKFREAVRENLRLQGLNVSTSVGGESFQKRPNDRTKDVEARYEGIRYSKWSNDGSRKTMV